MLNQETKKKIDSARDILVGKVPDPKAQVEQITTALIYKFMDDMDKEAQELGGKSRFFTNGYEKYSWTKLMDVKMGGHDRLDLYAEAISKLSLNPHIPQLFRDIFKDAFLPYRSPETLSLFLKEINGFTYTHSEDLGDAFEYLLSVLGSQGDAGQFRTPRHIIDFIVSVVDPKKDEAVCDPACGTAGFLISAYKHILKQHDGLDDPENKEKPLTPDERKNLMDHFTGYDISPDMVKLSRVNLYLHGFPSPTIHEYDTLSSEEKWDESFDVMLANPPFMTPKGGIRPHKRFSVQANRAEVLFVDYMLEHLRPSGRAGIIVPEGIIFKNDIAYKQLRKMLVEDGLFAVVSLPSGVFNPYAGVKTSILFFDNSLAKRVNHIMFVKVQSDGFDLGAQRRPVIANDLSMAVEALASYRKFIISGGIPDKTGWPGIAKVDGNPLCDFVSREEIAKSGDYNLSGERYKETDQFINQKWPMISIGEIAEVIAGQSPEGKYYNSNSDGLPFYQGKTEFGNMYLGNPKTWTRKTTKIAEKSNILMSVRAPVGPVNIATQKICIGRGLAAIKSNGNVNQMFLFYNLKLMQDKIKGNGGSVFDSINKSQIERIKIPLPPIEVQEEIVEQIEVKQNAIAHAKEIVKSLERERRYFSQSLRKLEGVEWVELGTICNLEYGFTDTARDSGDARFIRITDIDENGMIKTKDKKYISLTGEMKKFILKKDDLIVARTGATYGKTAIFKESYPAVFASYLIKLDFENDKILPDFYWLFSQTDEYWNQAKKLMTGGGQQQFNANAIKKIVVPIVSLDIQKRFIAEAEKEQQIIDVNRQLIEIMENKIKHTLNQI